MSTVEQKLSRPTADAVARGLPEVLDAILVSRPRGLVLVVLVETTADSEEIKQRVADRLKEEDLPPLQILAKYESPRYNRGRANLRHVEDSVDWHLRMGREGSLISLTRLSPRHSFRRRLFGYLRERYDPAQFGPFYVLLTFALLSLFRDYYDASLTAELVLGSLLLTAMVFSFFLLLRVMDEHKDWESDQVAFPERILSLELITLRQLRYVGMGCALFLLVAALAFGIPMVLMTLVMLAYALLMRYEFFAGEWLRRRVFLYAITHNVVVFLSIHMVFLGFGLLVGLKDTWRNPDTSLAALAINGLFFSLEVARKVRTPEREVDGVDTYSNVIGLRAAVSLAVLLHVPSFALLALSGFAISALAWSVLATVWLILVLLAVRLIRRPTAAGADGFIKPVSLSFLAYLAVLIALG